MITIAPRSTLDKDHRTNLRNKEHIRTTRSIAVYRRNLGKPVICSGQNIQAPADRRRVLRPPPGLWPRASEIGRGSGSLQKLTRAYLKLTRLASSSTNSHAGADPVGSRAVLAVVGRKLREAHRIITNLATPEGAGMLPIRLP